MDVTAQTIVDVLLSTSLVPEVVNVVHPRPVVLRDILDALNVVAGGYMEIISFQQWITKLQTLSTGISTQDVQRYVSQIPSCWHSSAQICHAPL